MGEIIPIELAFSASIDNTYEMSTRSYDRSGRLNLEEFHVSPSGRDPLHNYYGGGLFGGFIGGGLGGSVFLSSQPQVIKEELNEWVATDQPGQYSLYITSTRVNRRGGLKPEPVELRSNTLRFEVIEADLEWLKRSLSAAIGALDSPGNTPEQKQSAIRTLRFLDSPESVRELVRQLAKPGNTSQWNFVAGLFGSRHPELVLQELERQLGAPDTAISADYLTVLAGTKFLLDRGVMSPYPQQNEEEQKLWQARYLERTKRFCEWRDTLYGRIAGLIGSKQGAARAETAQTVLLHSAQRGSKAELPAALPGPEVASAFLGLSPDEQSSLLQFSWSPLKVPEMVDALEKILDQQEIHHQLLRAGPCGVCMN